MRRRLARRLRWLAARLDPPPFRDRVRLGLNPTTTTGASVRWTYASGDSHDKPGGMQ